MLYLQGLQGILEELEKAMFLQCELASAMGILSKRLKQQAQSLRDSAPGPLCIHDSHWSSAFILNV